MRTHDRLIIALDVDTVLEASEIVSDLEGVVSFYKVGYQLALSGGMEFTRTLKELGKKVFLDLKLLDIENTVINAVKQVDTMKADFLTVHAYPQAMRAAVRALEETESALQILGVSVLTSLDEDDLAETGYGLCVSDLVLRRAQQAKDIGMGGLVCSGHELTLIREAVGADLRLVVPGIRLDKAAGGDDQKRVLTPFEAMRRGADHLVIGRPVTKAEDRKAAAMNILEDIEKAVSS